MSAVNEAVIYLLDPSGTSMTQAQMNTCTSKMSGADLSARTARSYMSLAKKHWDTWGPTSRRDALSSMKGARKEMLSAVNQACDAVEVEIKLRK